MSDIPSEIMEEARALIEGTQLGASRSDDAAEILAEWLLAAEQRGIAKEREQIAEICDAIAERAVMLAADAGNHAMAPVFRRGETIAQEIATAIRERKT